MRWWLGSLLLVTASLAQAHQFQTLAVTLEQVTDQQVVVTLKSSLGRDGRPSNVAPRILPPCEPQGVVTRRQHEDLALRSWTLHCAGGLQGRQLRLQGLGPASPDAVVSLQYADGSQHTQVLDIQQPWLDLQRPVAGSAVQGLLAYMPIGIAHILGGPDHLLFVLCLMLVIVTMQFSWLRLLTTVTAFTVAHSLTLAASVLYGVSLASAAVEAVIALSILLLAVEQARYRRDPAATPGLSLRYPAAVAFAFGLLHGFGFAGALTAVGLPEAAQGWALLLFNLGVELGQLLFVILAFALYQLLLRGAPRALPGTQVVMVTVIGAISAFWFIDRLLPVLIL